MKIIITEDYNELSVRAASVIIDIVKHKPHAVLGLATGTTPLGLYERLIVYRKPRDSRGVQKRFTGESKQKTPFMLI